MWAEWVIPGHLTAIPPLIKIKHIFFRWCDFSRTWANFTQHGFRHRHGILQILSAQNPIEGVFKITVVNHFLSKLNKFIRAATYLSTVVPIRPGLLFTSRTKYLSCFS